MKLLITLIFLLAIQVFAQYPNAIPIYDAVLQNDSLAAPNQYEFDIVIKHTGGGAPFECQGIQIGLLFNNLIKNNGKLDAQYLEGTSELLPDQVPNQPALGFVTTSQNTGVFKLAPRVIWSKGNGTIIPPEGIRVGRFRISTSASSFKEDELINLQWNFTSTVGRYPSKISAFVADSTAESILAKEITVQSNHKNFLFNTADNSAK